jgi:hypothetical protein
LAKIIKTTTEIAEENFLGRDPEFVHTSGKKIIPEELKDPLDFSLLGQSPTIPVLHW